MIATPIQKNEAVSKLKTYEGKNPYILALKRDVFIKNRTDILNDFNTEYILNNYAREPRRIDKVVKIGEWYSKKKVESGLWNVSFNPQKIQIISYLGETSTCYHCYIKYKQNMPAPIQEIIPKRAVYEDFLLEDYHDVKVDFERYDKLSETLRPDKKRKIKKHQQEGVQFLLSRKKCILADDPGAGKTTTLSVASVEGNFDSILVICPASLKTNWMEELSYYVHEREITIIGGFQGFKKEDYERFLGYSVGKSGKKIAELTQEAKEKGKWNENRYVIINYDILKDVYELPKSRKKADIEHAEHNRPLLDFIKGKKSLIIIDEAHNFSKMDSQQYKIVKDLINKGKPHSVYLATGTPITNNPKNFFAMLSLINAPITDDWNFYMARYCKAFKVPINAHEKEKKQTISRDFIHRKGKGSWYDLTDSEKKDLEDLIDRNVRRRVIANGADNLDELRDRTSHLYLRRLKEDLNEGIPPKYYYEFFYDLDEFQKAEYSRLWDEYEAMKKEENPSKELDKDLLEGGLYRRYLSNQMVPHTEAFVDKCIAKGEKVVVACCYDEELYSLRDYYGERCVVFNGKMNAKEKDEARTRFCTDPNVLVFIGNIDAAGVGINLIESRVLIFNNISWRPADNNQMCDRVHRIGQKRDVHIYYQFFRNTQYEDMWNKVLKKSMVINEVIKKEGDK